MWDIVALDLDGTLLDSDHSIAEETKAQLALAVDSGTWITIATGRGFSDTVRFMEENGLGAKVGYPQSLICEERDLYFLTDGAYRADENWNQRILELERADLPRVRTFMEKHGTFERFYINSQAIQEERGFVEFVFSSLPAAMAFCQSAPADADWPTGFKPVRNHRGVSLRRVEGGKAPVLLELAKRNGASTEAILAAGDSHNDLEMLTCGVYPATTANADEEIQAAVLGNGGYVSPWERSRGVADILHVHRQQESVRRIQGRS